MYKEFLLLEDTIKEKCKDGPIYYFANPGNYGDSLIRHATLKFFNHIGLEFIEQNTFSRLRLLNPKGTLIFGGGGAWCNLYNHGELAALLSKRFKQMLILPSTYELTVSVSKIRNTTYFCRDKFESQSNMPEALFCHDMAFFIGQIDSPKGNGNGYFFRTDIESSKQISLPTSNYDISTTGNHKTPVYRFFDEISKFETIYTDRLHVAIAASLMNKEVHLYAGSYFKSRAIYLSSIKDFFPNTHFHDEFDFKGTE
jgi:exopolysaccharide biosynthesis predicted pyruvyltransferase EpsI